MCLKKALTACLAITLCLFHALPALAEEEEVPLFDVRVSEWASKAEASWQISFPSNDGITESELKYDDIDSYITIIDARIRPNTDFSLGFNLGAGTIDGAEYTDIDRSNGWAWSESKGEVDGNVRLWGANLYLHVVPKKTKETNWFDLFLGYQHYEDELRMFNGRQTLSQPSKTSVALGPLSGLNSTYDFEWDYAQLGAQAGHSFIGEPEPGLYDLGISASLAIIPLVHYEGTGVWNLRASDNWAQDPSFRHESNEGRGMDANIAFNYSPHRQVDFILGYRYFYLEATDGTDTTYYTSGQTSTDKLDEVKIVRHGPFISLAIRF